MSGLLRLIIAALLLPALAQAAVVHVPQSLQDWEAWVLHDKEYLQCPFLFDRPAVGREDYVCAWPGTLQLSVDADGGRFTQAWTVIAREEWVTLPGSAEVWPEQVAANGRSVQVVLRDGRASVLLVPGVYQVSGNFAWEEQPSSLEVAVRTGLIQLTANGSAVARPEVVGSSLFLGEREREPEARDAVTVDVYRLVTDDVPTRLVTNLRVNVSGALREELFGPLLPDGFVPLGIDSPLPARLEPDGNLRVQVRPGQWVISLTARAPAVLDQIALAEPVVNLPGEEIWSYRANDRLRVTSAEGRNPVDPLQVRVPDAWRALPAFRVVPGDALNINERSRGIVSAENALRLRRQMWLDFDRSGYYVSDDIDGTMRTGWRLDMELPFALLSAKEADDNLLITQGDQDSKSGVELRRRDVSLAAIGRTGASSILPVTGWQARFGNVSAILHVPPGNRLIAAPGVDYAPGSWVSQWQLLDFFLLLVITIGAWRLFGRTAGLISLFALVLSFHEFNAPQWLWLNLLIAVALLRVAPRGRLRQAVRGYQLASAVLLVLVLVPFLASQLRIAIYPQLEPQFGSSQGLTVVRSTPAPVLPAAESPATLSESGIRSEAMDAAREVFVAAQRAPVTYARYAPNAIVQAGPGKPDWAWNSYRLDWSGPVDAGQTMRLVVFPRWVVTVLRFFEVFALLLLAGVFAAEILSRRWSLPGGLQLGGAISRGLLVICSIGLLLGTSLPASAQTPDPELLRELERRLTQPPECAPRCAEMIAADIDLAPDTVSMSLTVNALDDVALPLPGSDRGWRPTAVLLDGAAASRIMRGNGRELWVQLPAGRHTIRVAGPIPAVDSLEIPFPTPPRIIDVTSDAWFVAGVENRRLISGSLQLTRLQSADESGETPRWESSRFPPFVRIERTVSLDLDWSVTTTVFREAPAQGAVTLQVPLLDGESVVTEGISVEDGSALVSMNPDQRVVSWRSTLERVSPLQLDVASDSPWRETWSIGVGSIWHAEFEGIPESENPGASPDSRIAEFFPRGGETLTILASRPEAAEGSTLAFDSADLAIRFGGRSADATLTLDYRSTRGAQHVIRLPDAAEVTEVLIDGETEPLRAIDGALTVPILPGEHNIRIGWRSTSDVGLRATTPDVDIGAPASNVALHIELPTSRWLLATSGPKLGPAVLYWSELVVLLLFAAILGRTGLAPLTTKHWLLLGLGFSTFSWPVFAVVVAWLLICGAREKWGEVVDERYFNLVQLVIGAATVAGLAGIVASLPVGLLGTPDMHLAGYRSFGNLLNWFADKSGGELPTATAWTAPMWIYKALILAWALWLSFALIRWLPWVWRCFSSQGLWRPKGAGTKPAAGATE